MDRNESKRGQEKYIVKEFRVASAIIHTEEEENKMEDERVCRN